MALKEIVKMVELDLLLHEGNTGDSRQLAKRVGVSRSTLFNLFEELKELGAEIGYNSNDHTYYYRKEVKIHFTIASDNNKRMLINDLKKIVGGGENSCPAQDFELPDSYLGWYSLQVAH